ncbi:MAG: SAM-dependent DNA methyltransferase [Chloroflexi bacterium]|nr:SAM-dependent DNA methyltransferase [Chloroflexota bacterium]
MPQVTEWEFTADIASRINLLLREHGNLPFSEVRAEARAKGSVKRRDLTLYDRNGKPVLTGEVKMPDNPEGRTPFQQGVVEDAHRKADAIGVNYNFTWNINRFVLWNTFEHGKPITERAVEQYNVLPSPIRNSDETQHPRVQSQIDAFLLEFLARFAALLSGERPMLLLPLDEKFIFVYEASLEQPVAQTLAALNHYYERNRDVRRELDRWMRDEQGWVLSNEEGILRDNLERAAKFSCYVLANKIVFYKALRRRFAKLRALRMPKSVTTGIELGKHLAELFRQAIEVTGDYETVFKGNFGDSLPYLSDEAVDSWRELSEQTDAFDFTQINHEFIGQIFERLLSTEERHKYGQHYTRSEVVDLINTFCIRKPEARVLDPACGGGTFLVRAYARKRALSNGQLHHRDLIRQLYGFDVSAYPVHLTTINLVTRDLIDEANYPLVARRDFFKVRRNDTPFNVPFGSNGGQITMEAMGKVDAVVGNPPYVRQEKITEYYGSEYKRHLQDEIAKKEAPGAALSGRSDIHVYFFPHAASFLEDGGYLGLLTSSTWLDTGYGFRLQKYLLDNFEIIAIFESASEPWFTGARVTTAATILRKQADPAKRAANIVHFVKIQRELSDILNGNEDDDSRRRFLEQLRDHVEGLTTNETTENWRIRCVQQGELYKLGQLAIEMSDDEEDENGENGANQHTLKEEPAEYHAHPDDYVGYKWGIFLRAPEIFFKLRDRAKGRLTPLGEICRIKYGLKSGADDFFYPEDITDEELARLAEAGEFKKIYGITPTETKKLRVVRAGDGSAHLIEAKYLQPEVHSIMELNAVKVLPELLNRCVLLVDDPKRKLKSTYTLRYIGWGEREGYDQTKTVQGRVQSGRLWYDVTSKERAPVLWSKAHQYRHLAFLNPQDLISNCRMYDLFPNQGIKPEILCAVLNSTVVALTKSLFGRYVGREGSLDTEVLDAKMMLVPDPEQAHPLTIKRLRSALNAISKRDIVTLVDVDGTGDEWSGELAQEDRQELDDAVLELLGIASARERKALRAELYGEMTKLYREIRTTEKKMQKFRAASARRGRPSPGSLAEEIWETFNEKPVAKTLADFVPSKAKTETATLPQGKAKSTSNDMFNPHALQFGGQFIPLGSLERVEFALQLSEDGINGQVAIPVDSKICEKALREYRKYANNLSDVFTNAAAGYTADEQMQERVVKELWKLAGRK